MDGGRRLLQSVSGLDSALAPPRPLCAAAAGVAPSAVVAPVKDAPRGVRLPARRGEIRKPRPTDRLLAFFRLPGLGLALTAALFSGVGLVGVNLNGDYAAFVRENGAPRDIVARALGFGLDYVTVTGQVELTRAKILKLAGVNSRQSLLFLDVNEVRNKLLALPLVKDASVRKLFPDSLVIDVTERKPYALWQKDGAVSVIAADGARIGGFHDVKFEKLPFVVGDGANLRAKEFASLLAAAGDIRSKIRAGILVSQRRWTLVMKSGVEVKLPEADPQAAVRLLARLDKQDRLLEKDVVTLDFRVPGKLYVRLTDQAIAARAAAQAHHRGARL